jgi:predicted RecB family nuclease
MVKRRITAQDLYNYTKCLHRVFLDSHGDPLEKSEVSAFVKLLWEVGLQTERDYIRSLGDQEVVDLQDLGIESAFQKTLSAMEQGAAMIYQGCLIHENLVGRPDLLVKREDGSSRFGPFLYEPVDIKAGKGWEEAEGRTRKFKEHYAFQIIFYRLVLEKIQGTVPPDGRIINVDRQIEEFDPAPFEGRFHQAMQDVQQLVSGAVSSEPVLGSHCTMCGWFTRCYRWVKTESDPTGIFFVGKQKFALREQGLRTIEDIAGMDVQLYLAPPRKIPRMGKASLSRMKERARVLLEGKPVIRPGYRFPEVEREIYFDIEDDPTRGVTYLYGMVIQDQHGPPTFTYYLAKTPEEEERTVRAFWDFIRSTEHAVYYVYSHKERSTLKRLMEQYHLDADTFEKYKACEFDLYQDLIVEYSDWPTFSYGIKHIAKFVGFRWRDVDPSGANSIAWYNDYLENPGNEALLNRILEYNEDDCYAMAAIKRYFERRHSMTPVRADGPALRDRD